MARQSFSVRDLDLGSFIVQSDLLYYLGITCGSWVGGTGPVQIRFGLKQWCLKTSFVYNSSPYRNARIEVLLIKLMVENNSMCVITKDYETNQPVNESYEYISGVRKLMQSVICVRHCSCSRH